MMSVSTTNCCSHRKRSLVWSTRVGTDVRWHVALGCGCVSGQKDLFNVQTRTFSGSCTLAGVLTLSRDARIGSGTLWTTGRSTSQESNPHPKVLRRVFTHPTQSASISVSNIELFFSWQPDLAGQGRPQKHPTVPSAPKHLLRQE